MTEHRSPDGTAWSATGIAAALDTEPQALPDAVAGNGWRFRLGRPPGTELELFPAAGVVRVASPDVHVALVRQDPPAVEPAGVIFVRTSERGTSRLVVAPDGAVTLALTPIPPAASDVSAPETPADVPLSAERPMTPPSTAEPVSGDPGAAETASDNHPDQQSTPETQPRLTLRGRLGAAPRFRTTRNDRLIGRFPLAVHEPEADATTWHTVVAFGERAARLQTEALRKGELIDVIGYEHERTFTDKAGQERKEVELFAAVIKRV